MKNKIICLFTLAILFFTPSQVHAGFIMKKQAVAATTTTSEIATNNKAVVTQNASVSEASEILAKFAPPSFARARGRGLVGTLALVCGILGFFMPLFSIGAVVLGFMGMGKHCRNSGMAIAGLVLGLIVVFAISFAGFGGIIVF